MTFDDGGAGTDLDEFDLDLAWGELGPHSAVELYLPTGREIPGETCNTNNATCPDTCRPTCPATCRATCPDTCRGTCRATCERTCIRCPTELGTHCPTCRCEQP
ncbi:hypothetical protein [Nonomuraea rubra]|uniref:hypothetical protein n=1 Tax=Nonomuraea rubra TaxID=46180 RepID=UPI0033ED417A